MIAISIPRRHTLKTRTSFLFLAILLAACAPATAPVTPRLVSVYVTSAAYPRLGDFYACAPSSIVIRLSDPASAELSMRIGEPQLLTAPAYQVGTEDILVINHPQAGVGALTLEQTRQLFSGRVTNWKDVGGNDLPVQVWTFAAGEDIQQIFKRDVMNGRPITSLARLAVNSQYMSDQVGNTVGSIGYLARRWKAGNTREALSLAGLPVLVVAKAQPEGPIKALIACLQAKK